MQNAGLRPRKRTGIILHTFGARVVRSVGTFGRVLGPELRSWSFRLKASRSGGENMPLMSAL